MTHLYIGLVSTNVILLIFSFKNKYVILTLELARFYLTNYLLHELFDVFYIFYCIMNFIRKYNEQNS